jgi:hypothetical protein
MVSHNFVTHRLVIPGNPGSQSGVARPGIQEFKAVWIPAFAGMTEKTPTWNRRLADRIQRFRRMT